MTMTDITIPPAALEAAYNARRNGDTLEDICLAMIRAWPHATIGRHTVLSRSPSEGHAVHLPLPLTQEPTAFEMFPPDDEYNWGDT